MNAFHDSTSVDVLKLTLLFPFCDLRDSPIETHPAEQEREIRVTRSHLVYIRFLKLRHKGSTW